MITSMFTAVSGINANGTALSVISDNIANMNTTGFKSSRASFGDTLSQTLSEGQIGRGVAVRSITPMLSQGSFETSSDVLDMAIDGDGFFMVENANGTYYTRAGTFGTDADGDVVTASGDRLQGYLYDTTGTATGVLGDINLASLSSSPNATTEVSITANLDSRVTIGSTFDETDPTDTSNFSTSITAYDSLGNAHVVNVYFRKHAESTSGNTWQYFAVVDDSESASGSTEIQAAGTLTFDTSGRLDTETDMTTFTSGSGTTFTFAGFDFDGGPAQDQSIDFDFGTSITTDSGTGLDGTTQFGSASATTFLTQDGYASGSLKTITTGQDGIMTGIFTNGQTRSIAQVALAKFTSPTNLTKMGKNLYAESASSGQPVISQPNSSGVGEVLANTLELSNVDLGEEFVRMILSQRGFQANSRVVSTSDELMMELVNMKR